MHSHVLSDLLGTHQGMSVSGLACLLRDFAVYVSLSSRTSPRYSQGRWGILLPAALRLARDKRVLHGPVAQLVRARA